MRALLFQTYERISASYWFLPSVMAPFAALLAFVLIQVDLRLPPDFYGHSAFLFAAQPDGARAVLSAIGGSMIGVAGTVFSVTMATVVFASGSYGPRLLTNFMNDRGNQVTLGVFVATFVYSMLVLRSVRDAAEGAALFVPNTAVFGAIILALGSIAVLIYFIHHVPSNIHISNVIAGIAHALLDEIGDRFPKDIGEGADDTLTQAHLPDGLNKGLDERTAGTVAILAARSGYAQVIDDVSLMKIAKERDIVIRLSCQPGSFVHPGLVLFTVWPARKVDDDLHDALLATVALGNARTPAQDILFLFDELVEIAGRALSPGVNDPFTAVTCIDWLSAAFSELAGRRTPGAFRMDDDGVPRIIVEPHGFAEYLDHAFGRLRQYAARDRIAGARFIEALTSVVGACGRRIDIESLRQQKAALLALAAEELPEPSFRPIAEAAERFDRAAAQAAARRL
ncbi:DUF2254 domain-containing protein [Consotaella salsifontis]|uniref:Uncharacterized membrane protein n=1 Tax=Consotaella salsifontis TaxID=1365950 RepID=A0A1T4RF04_9HYPH|nr:DUF2254 domain-containing protein [Consotaella salsifontis]SKA14489.1 Uncharacterized membrane protein [Consotaella salsifontis]